MKKEYKTVIYGASASALAIAAKDAENVLIIESSCLIAADYIDSFRTPEPPETEPESKFALEVAHELKSRGIYETALRNYAAAVPSICEIIHKLDVRLLLCSELISASSENGKVKITALCQNVTTEFYAERFIDTTPNIGSIQRAGAYIGASLNSVVRLRKPLETFSDGDFSLSVCAFEGCGLLKMKIVGDENFSELRKKLYDYLNTRTDMELVCISGTKCIFARPFTAVTGNGMYFRPDCVCAGLISAFNYADKGAGLI